MNYTYLAVNMACLLPTLALSFHKKIGFYRHWQYIWPGMLSVALFFLLWDAAFTYFGIWRFNPERVTGLYLANLRIEEILFFFCIPFACLFTSFCFEKFWPLPAAFEIKWQYFFVTGLVLGAFGMLMYSRLYTSVTFVLLGLTVTLLSIFHSRLLLRTALTFMVLTIPMFLSNGVLTGSFGNEPVVLYNDDENLGIRVVRIPVEDFFYGYLFYILNVLIYERIRETGPEFLPVPSSEYK